jgi:NitT/TauT family transport system permease protein
MRGTIPISVEGATRGITRWDALAILLTLGILVFVAEASRHFLQPLVELQMAPLSLAPENLPEYAARTTLRMFLALILSLGFTFTYATFGPRASAPQSCWCRCSIFSSRCQSSASSR